jgi:hypothetical protein
LLLLHFRNSLIFDDYFYNKNIKLKTTNSSGIDW